MDNPKLNVYFSVTGLKGIKYLFKDYHRNNKLMNKKAIWKISYGDELESFKNTMQNKLNEDYCGWGVHVVKGKVENLGINPHNEDLIFAKFIDGTKSSKWHGYPADYVRKTQDKPNDLLLKYLYKKGIISKPFLAKVKQGKRCNP